MWKSVSYLEWRRKVKVTNMWKATCGRFGVKISWATMDVGLGSATIQIPVVLNNVFRMWLFTNGPLRMPCFCFISSLISSQLGDSPLYLPLALHRDVIHFRVEVSSFLWDYKRLMGDHTAALLTYSEYSPTLSCHTFFLAFTTPLLSPLPLLPFSSSFFFSSFGSKGTIEEFKGVWGNTKTFYFSNQDKYMSYGCGMGKTLTNDQDNVRSSI